MITLSIKYKCKGENKVYEEKLNEFKALKASKEANQPQRYNDDIFKLKDINEDKLSYKANDEGDNDDSNETNDMIYHEYLNVILTN